MTQTVENMPDIVTDRSPELRRSITGKGDLPGLSFPVARVTVGEKDIEEGKRGDGAACALARAYLRTLPRVAEVDLSGEHPALTLKDGSKWQISLAPEVIDWIGRFDRGEQVEPLDITMWADL